MPIMIVLTLITTLLLIVVAGIRIRPSVVSKFELRRRSKANDQKAEAALRREERLAEFATVLWLKQMLLIFLVVIFSLLAFGWWLGGLYACVVLVTFAACARTAVFQSASRWVWARIEAPVEKFIEKARPIIQTLRIDATIDTAVYRRFDSRQELEYLLKQSGTVLTPDERQVLIHGLQFNEKKVAEVMTPRAAIDSINKSEFLGPLTLSELHELGHSRLPVIDEDIDHVVGVLHIRELLSLDNKKSATAEAVMDARVYYIHADDTLKHALAAFITSRRHLFIVINEQRETVGVISLEDVIEALIGRKIMDEDDNHEDLQAVAKRRGQSNNQPKNHVDL